MAFKTMKEYNEQKFGGLFVLRNDGDYADVIFMYRSADDVLIADTHYIKSADYSGYVHCCGRGCPACGKGIRVQTKLFIPLFNITAGELQFWDRTMRFEPQLQQDVFARFSNPSEYVFRITRHGAAGDVNTTYEIQVIGKNEYKSYAQILADNNAQFPDYFEHICKEVTAGELNMMVNVSASAGGYSAADIPAYTPSPRVSVPSQVADTGYSQPPAVSALPEIPQDSVSEDLDDDDVAF